MKKYIKPKFDGRGEPEYWNKEFPPDLAYASESVYKYLYDIENLEEKVIYLNWLKNTLSEKSDSWRFDLQILAAEIEESLTELKETMGNKRFYSVNLQDDFQIKNDFYGKQTRMSIVLYPAEASLIERMIKFIGPKNLIYIAAIDFYNKQKEITYKKAFESAIERFGRYFPDIQFNENDFTKWRERNMDKLSL